MEAEVMKRAAELIMEARDHRTIEISRPSDILTIVANALCAAADENPKPMKIGRYNISLRENVKVWLGHENGEGMEFDEATMNKWLDKLWDEEF